MKLGLNMHEITLIGTGTFAKDSDAIVAAFFLRRGIAKGNFER